MGTNFEQNHVAHDDRYEALRKGTSLPFIVFGDDYVEGRGDFKPEDLKRALQRTAIPDTWAEPTKYYPFSHDETINVIVPYALHGLMLCILNDADFRFDPGNYDAIDAILRRTHAYHDRISSRHKKEIRGKIRETLMQVIQSNQDFAAQLDKIRLEGPSPAATHKLNSTCRRIIKNYAEQERLDQ